ncbi:biotin--[acetyl-CoA-carboxylase] ligase [Fructobacillus americanaquae]|uniref:biotin--[biotin carboxyl-carrier protein] ligase n=1 Tax=Fructobacillus americanaquae TaxID=2940302 RepID=A0ABY5BZZ4_9LACO|nr:biotin--[acetyl-CoA-carboxylase] ligase [Fructobacillus americanaquae]USS92060.1 biotin--[acetyl-CoA-carboxylase] ligase [Fructobacillus americanaquae]
MEKQERSTKDRVLAILLTQPGVYFSGDSLAQVLNLSRESIWKAVRSLKVDGHQIASRKKAGYAYLSSRQVDPLVLKQWLHLLDSDLAENQQPKVRVFEQIDSTQAYAKDLVAKQPLTKPTLLVAREQSGGYGRQGRAFYSPKDRGLYVSLVMPVAVGTRLAPSLLTTSAAVALVQGLQVFFPAAPFQLKWVNDLILHRRKIGGVITEGIFDFESQQYSAVILGFAINLMPGAFPDGLESKAGTVLTNDANNLDLNSVLAQLVVNLLKMATTYQDGAYLPAYRERSLLIGHTITVKVGTDEKTGIVTGISDQGGLMMTENATGQQETLYAGEVTKVKLLENLNL